MKRRVEDDLPLYLTCSARGRRGRDDGVRVNCDYARRPALLRTAYLDKELIHAPNSDRLSRYRDWLPISRVYRGREKTVTFRGERLGRFLGLTNPWVAFWSCVAGEWMTSGWWAEESTSRILKDSKLVLQLPTTCRGNG